MTRQKQFTALHVIQWIRFPQRVNSFTAADSRPVGEQYRSKCARVYHFHF